MAGPFRSGRAPGPLPLLVLLLLCALGRASYVPVPVPIGPPELDCKVRTLAYEFAAALQPDRDLTAVGEALSLPCSSAKVNLPNSGLDTKAVGRAPHCKACRAGAGRGANAACTVFVDAVDGSATGAGTMALPLQTVQQGVDKAAATTGPCTVMLRGGTYYLDHTIVLTPKHSGLTIQGYNNEEVEVSGAVPLNPRWEPFKHTKASMVDVVGVNNIEHQAQNVVYFGKTPTDAQCSAACLGSPNCLSYTWHNAHNPGDYPFKCYFRNDTYWQPFAQANHTSGYKAPGANVWATDLTLPDGMSDLAGLRVRGLRAIKARHPNSNPETALFPEGWMAGGVWAPPKPPASPAVQVLVVSPNRTDTNTEFANYVSGVGGTCTDFYDPPAGYWCLSPCPRGPYTTRVPSAVTFPVGAVGGKAWAPFPPNRTTVTAFRSGHWFTYSFLVDAYTAGTDQMTLNWTVGGFQGGEGADAAGEFNVEGVFETLDAPLEWFYDPDGKRLYYFNNETSGGPDPDALFEATRLKELFRVEGSQSSPVKDLAFRGIRFTATASTVLDPHGLPSDGGGDWSLARSGALFFEGTENTVVESCLLTRLDGTAITISGYNRNVTIKNNEFSWIGENAMVSWGYTRSDDPRLPAGVGIDGTDGNHPQGSQIIGNLIREIGHYQKQVSCWFQAQTQTTTLLNNICFNGPRAGINFNDGFGGGNLISQNLVFNMVRETADHGPFNSWDRLPFLTLQNGKPTLVPALNEIRNNFMVNNYNPQEAIDNDDGSAYYLTHHNFFPYSWGGLKSDFSGHSNTHHHNIYYNMAKCMTVCGQLATARDAFYNNTCIMATAGEYAGFSCTDKPENWPIMHDNRVYSPTGTATECGKNISDWQALGHDKGTTVSTLPTDDEVLAMARSVLLMT